MIKLYIILTYLVSFPFNFYQEKTIDLVPRDYLNVLRVKPDETIQLFIDFYPHTDSIKGYSNDNINSLAKIYTQIYSKDFYVQIRPLKSSIEDTSYSLLIKRIIKVKERIKAITHKKIKNFKVSEESIELEYLPNATGFAFNIYSKNPGKPYRIRKSYKAKE